MLDISSTGSGTKNDNVLNQKADSVLSLYSKPYLAVNRSGWELAGHVRLTLRRCTVQNKAVAWSCPKVRGSAGSESRDLWMSVKIDGSYWFNTPSSRVEAKTSCVI